MIRSFTVHIHIIAEKLKKSTTSRIVNVASLAARNSEFKVDNLNSYPSGNKFWADIKIYGISKLCNVVFTTEMARRLEEFGIEGITVNTLHPGAIRSDIFRRLPEIMQTALSTTVFKYFKVIEII